jgi:hypothetical protein
MGLCLRVMTNLSDVSEVQAETEAPIVDDGGQGVVEATEEATEATPAFDEADLLDTSEIGDRMVRLTVDGEEVVVPLSEALSGYNSQAASTKRFQEAATLKQEAEASRREAEQAVNLARAVSNDPGMTMKVLASQAGLTVEQFLNLTPNQQQNIAEATEVEPEFSDPLEKALYQERQARIALEQRISAQEEVYANQQADARISQSIGALQSQYGATPEDARSVIRQAYEMRVGPEMFPMIYQSQMYQKSQATNSAQAEATAAGVAETAQRQQAAAQASNAISTGTGVVGTAPAQVVQPMTAEEAIRSTLEQLGVR